VGDPRRGEEGPDSFVTREEDPQPPSLFLAALTEEEDVDRGEEIHLFHARQVDQRARKIPRPDLDRPLDRLHVQFPRAVDHRSTGQGYHAVVGGGVGARYHGDVAARIRVGTSGYSFADWFGVVYPQGARQGDLLSYYARLFDTVEINVTYYRVPGPQMFAGMLRKVPSDFTFVLKLPKEMTHEREKLGQIAAPFARAAAPLVDAGRLGGLLAQFPWAFKPSSASIDHLRRLADALAGVKAPVNVEFRHASWYAEETYRALRDLGLGFVNVDLPALPDLPPPSNVLTSDVAYYRLHGRNKATWWSRGEGDVRYDYLYERSELEDWALRAEEGAACSQACFIFANNCHLGQSVVNALQLRERFSLPDPALPPGADAGMFAPSAEELAAEMRRRIRAARAESSKG